LDQHAIRKMHLNILVSRYKGHVDAEVGSAMGERTIMGELDNGEAVAKHGVSLLRESYCIVQKGEDDDGTQGDAPAPIPLLRSAHDEPSHGSQDCKVAEEE